MEKTIIEKRRVLEVSISLTEKQKESISARASRSIGGQAPRSEHNIPKGTEKSLKMRYNYHFHHFLQEVGCPRARSSSFQLYKQLKTGQTDLI